MLLAYQEATDIWSGTKRIDFGLSIGVEVNRFGHFPMNANSRGRLKSGSTMSGCIPGSPYEPSRWRRMQGAVPDAVSSRLCRVKPYTFRKIGNAAKVSIQALEAATHRYIASMPQAYGDALDSIYASWFCFELDCAPAYIHDSYRCNGVIFCQLQLDNESQVNLYHWLISYSAYFLIDGRPIPCCRGIPHGCPPFRCRVHFEVAELHNAVAISIRGVTSRPRFISGFPCTVEHLIREQGIEAPFGRATHRASRPLPLLPENR
jgi:hypothetical protein